LAAWKVFESYSRPDKAPKPAVMSSVPSSLEHRIGGFK